MSTKTFKIGEYCAGGIITVQTGLKKVTVIQKQWDYSMGSSKKSSSQKYATELDRIEVTTDEGNARSQVSQFLNDITTSYYASTVMDYIESKVTF